MIRTTNKQNGGIQCLEYVKRSRLPRRSCCSPGPRTRPNVFTISSSSFKDGALLPKKMAGSNKTNPNCVGDNVSPRVVAGATCRPAPTSFALVMTDPEGRGTGVDHWIAYGIPASVTSFAEGETSKPSDKYIGGIGTAKQSIYMGPCTPPGRRRITTPSC